jgi:hypothetical protein
LHQQDSFEDEQTLNELRKHPLHIYLICRSPKIMFDNTKTKITQEAISCTFYTSIQGKRKEIVISTINNKSHLIAKIETDYPYTLVNAFRPDGSEHSVIKSVLLLKILAAQQGKYFEEFDLEVLYVGQAFGENGERITVDRLKIHEKAQKIYFETQQKFPDYEVWFLSMSFTPVLMTMFKPWGDVDINLFDADYDKQEKLEQTPLSLDQQITVAEAALIRYFNTYQYNKEYLNFPSIEHKSYEDIYKMDFNSAAFEMSTSTIHTKLWSKEVESSFIHFKDYFLHSKSDRKSMFKWYE